MRTKKINSRDFDFEAFMKAEIAFIERNFLLEAPDAADTMRYFRDFANVRNKAAADKDFSKWEMEDFKNAILQEGEVIFLPFSSGPNLDGSMNLASGKTIRLERDGDDSQNVGLTDCVGFLVNLTKGKYEFRSAVAWGDMTHAIEEHPRMKVDREMNGFLKEFTKG